MQNLPKKNPVSLQGLKMGEWIAPLCFLIIRHSFNSTVQVLKSDNWLHRNVHKPNHET
jgi:hypothetical protein